MKKTVKKSKGMWIKIRNVNIFISYKEAKSLCQDIKKKLKNNDQ